MKSVHPVNHGGHMSLVLALAAVVAANGDQRTEAAPEKPAELEAVVAAARKDGGVVEKTTAVETAKKAPAAAADEQPSMPSCGADGKDLGQDICAQWMAADAARDAADWARWSTILAGLGFVLSAGGLYALMRTIKLGREANELATKVYETDFRPVLIPVGVKFSFYGQYEGVHARFGWKNVGKIPAKIILDSTGSTSHKPIFVMAGEDHYSSVKIPLDELREDQPRISATLTYKSGIGESPHEWNSSHSVQFHTLFKLPKRNPFDDGEQIFPCPEAVGTDGAILNGGSEEIALT